MKRVVSACIDRVFEFDGAAEMEKYLAALKAGEKKFLIMKSGQDCGKWRLRIREQYNKSPLLID